MAKTALSHYKIIILIILVGLGITLQMTRIIDLEQLIALARDYSDHWWLGLLLMAVQIALYTFAMAGSSMVWITAVLFTPFASTAIITAGTTFGAFSAYLLSERLSEEWTQKIRKSRIYKLLQKEGNFFTLFALRLMPGFPHSVINYSSGILRIKFINFLPATVIGTAIKTYVYSALIHNATTSDYLAGSISLSTVWPLLILSLLILAGVIVKRYLEYK